MKFRSAVPVLQVSDVAESVQWYRDVLGKTKLSREPVRMPYCDVEFAVTDPDGHEIVLSEQLPDSVSVPSADEREAS